MELKELEEKLQKSVNVLIDDLSKIQAGKVSATQLKPIIVTTEDGARTGIMEISMIRVINPKTLGVKPWDTSHLMHIEKAIKASNLGVNPLTSDGEVIIVFPDLTQERRKEIAKSITAYATNTKNALRSIRHDFLKEHKGLSKEEEVKLDKSLQKIMDKFNALVDEHVDKKQKALIQM